MDKKKLENKKILFFSPVFFGYNLEIKHKLEEYGATVDIYDDRPTNSTIGKILIRINPYLISYITHKYFNKIIKDNKGKDYDYVFFIKAESILKSDFKNLKNEFQSAKFILYLYDSLDNIKYYSEKKHFFDRIFSFDYDDCVLNTEMVFRPLFFLDYFKSYYSKADTYDLCFIGTAHSDRPEIIYNIYNQIKDSNIFYFRLYVPSKLIYIWQYISNSYFRKLHKLNILTCEKLTTEQVSDIVKKSNSIIDIEHPKQNGLTMRTIEMVGLNKKIITTNKNIQKYDFYNSSNIQIISREKTVIDISKLKSEYHPIPQSIYEKYSIGNWIEDVFS